VKHFRRVLIALVILTALTSPPALARQVLIQSTIAEVFFSPRGLATERLVTSIGQAEHSIRVQAYSFTSAPIIDALIAAHQRGVDVQIILDRSQLTARGSGLEACRQAGIPLRVDTMHAIAHNKIILIDQELVFTGSFNFTSSAEFKNAENLLVIPSRALAEEYLANWEAHWEHSQPAPGR
jgi:phosphatidylserine/phosphatidylglycerophosphate/cardiolipin synthase-like enzyme